MDGCDTQQGEYDYWLYSVGASGYGEAGQRVTAEQYEKARRRVLAGHKFYSDDWSFAGKVHQDGYGEVQICGKKFTVSASAVSN